MSWTAFYRQRAERFAQLLDEANGGRRHHIRSRVDTGLARPVAIGRRLQTVQSPAQVDPDFRASLRTMLIATAERDGIGATASVEPVAEATPARPSPTRSRRASVRPARRGQRVRVRARAAIVIGVAAGAIAVSGMSAASENAVPGDALYGMKRSTERAQLALASSDLSRGQLFLDFARTRLAEAVAVRGDSVGFAAVLADMDADTRQGIKLLTTSAVQRRNPAALDVINTFLDQQRRQVTGMLDSTPRGQRGRVEISLALLDSIERRSDGLRGSLMCNADPTGRTDALGPMPRTCAASRNLTEGSPGTVPQGNNGETERAPQTPRRERSEPSLPSGNPPDPEQPAVRVKPGELTGPTAGRSSTR